MTLEDKVKVVVWVGARSLSGAAIPDEHCKARCVTLPGGGRSGGRHGGAGAVHYYPSSSAMPCATLRRRIPRHFNIPTSFLLLPLPRW